MNSQTHEAVRGDQSIESIQTAPTPTAIDPTYDITSGEPLAEQPVLSTRAHVQGHEAATFIGETLRNIRAYMQEHDVKPAGPPFSICQPTSHGEIDVEAGWPIAHHAAGTAEIHCGDLPTSILHIDHSDNHRHNPAGASMRVGR